VVLQDPALICRLSKGGANEKTTSELTDVGDAHLKSRSNTNGHSPL